MKVYWISKNFPCKLFSLQSCPFSSFLNAKNLIFSFWRPNFELNVRAFSDTSFHGTKKNTKNIGLGADILKCLNSSRQPPSKTVKVPLKRVLKQATLLGPILNKCVEEVNIIRELGWTFLHFYLSALYAKDLPFPTFDLALFRMVLKIVSKSTSKKGGGPYSEKNKKIKDELSAFYETSFAPLFVLPSIAYANKSGIYKNVAATMLVRLKNHIKSNYVLHLGNYVNYKIKFPAEKVIMLEKSPAKRKKLFNILNLDIKLLKADLLSGKPQQSKGEYHDWILQNMDKLYPMNFTKSVAYDLKKQPQNYIRYSFYLNDQVSKLGGKAFQAFPKISGLAPQSIVFNTNAIIDYLGTKVPTLFRYTKSEMYRASKKYQKYIWSKVLKLEIKSIFDQKGYIFANQISTNGISCSVLFLVRKGNLLRWRNWPTRRFRS